MNQNVNKKHKSSVFSTLFSDPEILREVYSAIEGIDIPPDAIIDINTLSDAIYMRQINDISFSIDNRLVVLIEHQSTINNNVPIRLLMYLGRVYEKILDRHKLHQKRLVKIPMPEFIVLYNGRELHPDYMELKLSAAFENVDNLKRQNNDNYPIELIVKVYNINHGRNKHILEKSKTLDDYSLFISKIWEYKEKLTLEESMKAAIQYCIENDIIKDFLKKHGSEVVNMLFTEISLEELSEIRFNEGREIGREEGQEEGREEGAEKRDQYVLELINQGLSTEEIKQRLMQETKNKEQLTKSS